ncbi:MAG: outer membrane lipid asymmetry maintenance protein MlaD [Rhodospirillaceae bacterium]|nr:outer membrane lipid asymmetry maintenance protein MlaD [Rhodospirillaceae bacterium]|tara:strand:+ start:15687 stop:16169 length:483 start_codon:yes stop_codon:yes gene_type:complete
MGKNLAETLLGAVVLLGAVIFLAFAYSKGGLKSVDGYSVVGKFDRIDGLAEGSDVRMSGIKIGTVVSQELDTRTYLAVLTMNVKNDVKLPRDSSIRIASNGLLGDKYLSITPGAEDEMIKPGGEISHTQGSVDLLSLVGRMIFSQTGDKEKAADKKDGPN